MHALKLLERLPYQSGKRNGDGKDDKESYDTGNESLRTEIICNIADNLVSSKLCD